MNFQLMWPSVLLMHSFTHFVRFIREKTDDYWSIYCEFLDTECQDVKFLSAFAKL
jgi:hypothetical protein